MSSLKEGGGPNTESAVFGHSHYSFFKSHDEQKIGLYEEQSINYYSGADVYSKNISISKDMVGKNKKQKLDL